MARAAEFPNSCVPSEGKVTDAVMERSTLFWKPLLTSNMSYSMASMQSVAVLRNNMSCTFLPLIG
jgi:hypothetical protein